MREIGASGAKSRPSRFDDDSIMRTLPVTHAGQVNFCRTHVQPWLHNAAEIGLSHEDAEDFHQLTKAAEDAVLAAQAARNAAEAATLRQNDAIRTLTRRAAKLMLAIRARAALSERPDVVLNLAELPSPKERALAKPPEQPTLVALTLTTEGTIEISWSAKNAASGTGGRFDIYRSTIGPDGRPSAFTLLGSTHGTTARRRRMRFIDASLTSADAPGAAYTIEPHRGGKVGKRSYPTSLQFGRRIVESRAVQPLTSAPRRAA